MLRRFRRMNYHAEWHGETTSRRVVDRAHFVKNAAELKAVIRSLILNMCILGIERDLSYEDE